MLPKAGNRNIPRQNAGKNLLIAETRVKHSRYGIAALIFSAPIWIYFLAIFLCRSFLWAFLTMDQCQDNDFGACALKKLFGPILEGILLILLLIIPLLIYGISSILGYLGCKQERDKKTFAVTALINNAVSVVAALAGSFVLILLDGIRHLL